MPKLECVRECECVWVGACAATSEIERERGREGKRESERGSAERPGEYSVKQHAFV